MAKNQSTGQGRGWHGDSAGHAAAGRQSHKNSQKHSGSSASGNQSDDTETNQGNR